MDLERFAETVDTGLSEFRDEITIPRVAQDIVTLSNLEQASPDQVQQAHLKQMRLLVGSYSPQDVSMAKNLLRTVDETLAPWKNGPLQASSVHLGPQPGLLHLEYSDPNGDKVKDVYLDTTPGEEGERAAVLIRPSAY